MIDLSFENWIGVEKLLSFQFKDKSWLGFGFGISRFSMHLVCIKI